MPITWIINPFTGALDAIGTPGSGAPFVTSVAGGVGITNSPEPIVGAGTVNLDIDSLTTEASLASGDLFAFVDISAGGTAIDNQRKATFTNLVTFLGGSFQPLDAGLTALASLGAGIAVSDGADGWFARSIAVTDTATIDLTITNANGVAGNPTIQADIIVAGLNPLLDHGLLLGLTDDDHAQYTLRAGRATTTNDTTLTTTAAGVGSLYGGSAADATLRLQASSSGSAHTGFVRIDDAQDWWPNVPDLTAAGFTVAKFDPAITDSTASSAKRLLLFNPAFTVAATTSIAGTVDILDVAGTWTQASALLDSDVFTVVNFRSSFANAGNTSTPGPRSRRVFWDQSVTTSTGATTDNITLCRIMDATPTFVADGAGATLYVGTQNVGLRLRPTLSALNGGFVSGSDLPEQASFNAIRLDAPVLNTSGGGTIDVGVYCGLTCSDYGGLTGVSIPLSVRSLGAEVEMRHAGPGIFGANAARTNASVALEVQSTTRCFLNASMTTAQKTTLTGVAVANGMQLYDSTLNRMQFRENGAWVGYANGSGAATQVAYWSDADTLTGEAAFTWDATVDTLVVGSGASTIDGGIATGVSTSAITVAGSTVPSRFTANIETTASWAGFLSLAHGSSTMPYLVFARTRGTAASRTVVSSGDVLGQIDFTGLDATAGGDFEVGARIAATVDGTPGSGDMPGKLSFYTTLDGTATPNEQISIDNRGQTQMSITAPSVATTFNSINVLPNGATITASLSPAIRALLFQNTLTFAAAATTIGQLFQAAPTITTSGASRALGPLIGLGVNATFTPAPTHTITGTASRAVNHAPTFTDNGTAGSTATDVYGLRSAGNLNTNWTVTDWAGVKMIDPGGSGGTLTRLGAVEVDSLTRGTSNYSVWSKGSDVILSHAGGGAFATGTATFTALTNASVGLEVQGTTKAFRLSQLTDAQRTTLAGVAVGDGMLLYDSTRNTMSARQHSNWLDVPGWYHIIVKSADQTVTNTTTLTDDTELQFSVGADEVWHVELRLGMSGNNAASDAKWGFTAAAASFVVAQSNWNAVHYTAAAALTQVNATAFASTTEAVTGGTAAVDAGTSTTIWPVFAVYRFRTSAATTVKVQFALLAGAAVGRNAVMEAGSTLFARRIS